MVNEVNRVFRCMVRAQRDFEDSYYTLKMHIGINVCRGISVKDDEYKELIKGMLGLASALYQFDNIHGIRH